MSNMTNGPIFGDDGFRDRYGFGLMRKKNLYSFAMALSLFIGRMDFLHTPYLLVEILGKVVRK